MTKTPLDQANRDLATHVLTNSVFLDAGAGAGKSTTLISRIISVLKDTSNPLQIQEIVAITFTERAGTELRHKLRRAIIDEMKRSNSPQMLEALQNLENSKVGTIHSFAQSILREFAIEAELPPGFEVMTNSASKRAARQRCKKVLENSARLADLESYINSKEIRMSSLIEFVESLDSSRLLIETETLRAQKLKSAESALTDFIRAKSHAIAAIQGLHEPKNPSDPDGRFLAIMEKDTQLEYVLENYAEIDKIAFLKNELDGYFKIGGKGSAGNWEKDDKDQPKQIWLSLKPELARLMSIDFENEMRRFIAEISTELDLSATERQSQGYLEFDDLLSITLNLLKSKNNVRKKLHDKYKFLLIDEFQDTDPTQWEIIKLITSDPTMEGSTIPLPGRLLVVGDPKQAIFSFRGADINTYQSARKEFAEFGKEIQLTANFRSTPAIINWVNEVFSKAMTEPSQVEYEPLTAHRDNFDNSYPSVTVLRNVGEKNDKATEARLVAEAIGNAVSEKWQIHPEESEDGFMRDVKFSDIAVIYPTRTSLNLILNEFDSIGIPYRSADSHLVLERPIVKGLINLLRAVTDAADELSVWSALKTPIFGCTESELVEYAQKGGRWSGYNLNDAAKETRVGHIFAELISVRNMVHLSSPTQLIDELCSRFSVYQIASISPRGAFDADCVRMLRSFAQQWQDEGGSGIVEFCDDLEDFESNSSRMNFAAPDDRSDDAIKLMTIFSAKGLEFPIVAVAGLAAETITKYPKLGIKSPTEFEFNLSAGLSSSGWDQWLENYKKPQTKAERVRVLYVAATRARDALIFSMVGADKSKTFAGLLNDYINTGLEVKEFREISDISTKQAELSKNDAEWIKRIPEVRNLSAKPYVALPSGLAASVLGLASQSSGEFEPELPSESSASSKSLQYRDGAALGQAVHSGLDFLMSYQGEINDEVLKLAVQSAEASILTVVDESEVLYRLKSTYKSEIFQRALKAERKWPELYLSAPVDHEQYKLIEGFADLVFKDEDGYTIVDYKTDKEIDSETFQHYQDQLLSYKELFRRCTGESVNRLCILHIGNEICKVYDFDTN